MSTRVTQEAVEVFGAATGASTRVTQEAVEVFGAATGAAARVTQLAVEVFVPIPPAVSLQQFRVLGFIG